MSLEQVAVYDVPVLDDYLPAKRVQTYAQQKHRDQQRAQALINRLTGHINGQIEMSPTQIMAAKIVLAKCLPDLKSVEVKGDADNPVALVVRWATSSEK